MRYLCDDANTGDGNWPTEGQFIRLASLHGSLARSAQAAILLNFLLCSCLVFPCFILTKNNVPRILDIFFACSGMLWGLTYFQMKQGMKRL